jgi:hypothetical protein
VGEPAACFIDLADRLRGALEAEEFAVWIAPCTVLQERGDVLPGSHGSEDTSKQKASER